MPGTSSTRHPHRQGERTTAVATHREARVSVRCCECEHTFEVSARRERAYRAEGREPRCELCRRPGLVLSDQEREQFKRWWLEESGLSARSLYEIAVGLCRDERPAPCVELL